MEKDINLNERLKALMVRREMRKAERLLSMKNRLAVDILGFKTYYEDL